MHGIILSKLANFVQTEFPESYFSALCDETTLSRYLKPLNRQVPEKEVQTILSTLSYQTGQPIRQILEHFGRHIAPDLIETSMYFSPMEHDWQLGDLLNHAIRTIHEQLKKHNPTLAPPDLSIDILDDSDIRIIYKSNKRLCAFLIGIVKGTAAYLDTRISIIEDVCMHRGDNQCVIEVRVINRHDHLDESSRWMNLISDKSEDRKTIRLVNEFQGVPISSVSQVITDQQESLTLTVTKPHAALLKETSQTFISVEGLPKALCARISQVRAEGKVTLHDLCECEYSLTKRNAVRIIPPNMVTVELDGEGTAVGELTNVSKTGLAALFRENIGFDQGFSPRLNLTFGLTLQHGAPPVNVTTEGQVIHIHQDDPQFLVRIQFLNMESKNRQIVERFILRRQLEVMNELKKKM
ncbi:MAG: heme NO-binding domain-containing protein [Magnetococcales bacterium]|nr:heme NO-binding domain-containing protein [Magnetococcales bacterium]